jgi:hypothetical protein
MPDLGILNTLIAMVIVILVLSLIVQSIQTLVKKFFKLKSRTILNSLEDLFQTITQNPTGEDAPGAPPDTGPRQLVEAVTDRLKKMGRETLFGKPMLDSLAKGDLLKVLTRVGAENLLPGAVGKFQEVLGAVGELRKQLGEIEEGLLEGDASARFAALQASVMPLVNDIEALADEGKINPKVLLGDLYGLRQIKGAEVLDLLGQIQRKVGEDLAAAGAAGDAARLDGLQAVAAGLKRIAEQITALGQAFDAAFAPLRERLEQAEVWYDTVMQGFEERYARHMRTVALAISVVVVVLLNANFFTIYQAMSNPETAATVSGRGEDILQRSRQATAAQDAAAKPPVPNASPAPQPPPADNPTTAADLQRQAQDTKGWVDTYKSFGITPLTRQQVYNFFKGEYRARDVSGTFAGWLIMVMLLSAGAPFWQDTLESLFGLKNLLRQKSDTKNVEGERGGQPQP